MNLRIAELYADLVVKTEKFDSQLTAIYSKVARFDLPPLLIGADTSAFSRQMDSLYSKLEGMRKLASAKLVMPSIAAPAIPAAPAIKAPVVAGSAQSGPSGQVFPIAKLQVEGLKYQDALQKEADRIAATVARTNARIDAAFARTQARAVAEIQKASQARRAAMDRAMADRAAEMARVAEEAGRKAEIARALDDAVGNPTSTKGVRRTDEQRIIVSVANLEKVDLLKAAIDGETDAIRRLNAEFRAGSITLDQYDAATLKAAANIRAAKKEIGTLGKVGGFDSDRAGAKSRLALGGLNIAQDTIQGGSLAYGINNVLGMANDSGIKSLIGEGIQAVGGMKTLIGVLGGVTIAAGAAFLTIDSGLKSAKLDWSDFGTVVGNLAPFKAITEEVSGFGTALGDQAKYLIDALGGEGTADVLAGTWSGIFDSIGEGLGKAVTLTDEWTIGWGAATAAAKAHKDQMADLVRMGEQYNVAVKNMGRFKSDEQKEKAKTGELVGDVLADMGGAKGAEGLADRLAAQATKVGGDQKVTVREKDEKGNLRDVEITRREMMKRKFLTDMDLATKGDGNAIGRLTAGMNGLGLDPGRFDAATKGVDSKQEAKDKVDREADEAWDKTQQSIAEMQAYQKKRADREMEVLNGEAERNSKAWDAEVELAKKTQSFRLPGGADGLGGLRPSELEAKRQNDLEVAQKKLFQVSDLTMADSSHDWLRQVQESETKRGHDDENAKNHALTAKAVQELLEETKRQGGPQGAAAIALLGPA